MVTTRTLLMMTASAIAFSCGGQRASDRSPEASAKDSVSEQNTDGLRVLNGSTSYSNDSITVIEVTRNSCLGGGVSAVKSYCSAIVVDSKTLLTAAHCIARLCKDQPVKPANIRTPWLINEDLRWIAAPTRYSTTERYLAATEAKIFDGFTGLTRTSGQEINSSVDLGMIRFSEAMGYAVPAIFAAFPDLKVPSQLHLTGYGFSTTWGSFLRQYGLMTFSKVSPTLVEDPALPPSGYRSIVMLRGVNGTVGCGGDSGGALGYGSKVYGVLSASYSSSPDGTIRERCLSTVSNTFTEVNPVAIAAMAKTFSSTKTYEVQSSIVVDLDDGFDGLAVSNKVVSTYWKSFSLQAGYTGAAVLRAAALPAPSLNTASWSGIIVPATGTYRVEASYIPSTISNVNCVKYELSQGYSTKVFGTLNQTLGTPVISGSYVMKPIVGLGSVSMAAGLPYTIKLIGSCALVYSGKYTQADALLFTRIN